MSDAGTNHSINAKVNFSLKSGVVTSIAAGAMLNLGPAPKFTATGSAMDLAGSVVNIGGTVNMQAAIPGNALPPTPPIPAINLPFIPEISLKIPLENPPNKSEGD
jgi:hypothetical protein